MRAFRWGLLVVLLGILGVAIYQTLHWFGWLGGDGESQVLSLHEHDQEIALIEPATSTDDWSRIVTALQLMRIDWPKINPDLPPLHVNLDNAFPRRTAEVSEIVLSFAENPQQHLRLRWYKISGEHDAASWVRKLHARGRPPLAIIGGGTSNRAVGLARALQATYPKPDDPAPVFLITTATAESTGEEKASGEEKRLIEEYARRSFRFSFTNQKMVKSLLRFVQQTPNLWPTKSPEPKTLAHVVAGMVGTGDALHVCAALGGYPQLQPHAMQTISWEDERYSIDLANLFTDEFQKRHKYSETRSERIQNSVGGFFFPAPLEQDMVETMLTRPIAPRSFLVLPTQAVRMRRVLINLRQRAPLSARNLVILNGDAISFHNVYRDRAVMWNILDLPYSLVFFAHRNPIDRAAGFRWVKEDSFDADAVPQKTTSGTHDILLYRDLFEAFLYAACDKGTILDDPRAVRDRLRETRWYHPPEKGKQGSARVGNRRVHTLPFEPEPFFDSFGNRKVYTGEHIVWVKPSFTDDQVDRRSRISIWSSEPRRSGGAWQLVEEHDAAYNQTRGEEPQP